MDPLPKKHQRLQSGQSPQGAMSALVVNVDGKEHRAEQTRIAGLGTEIQLWSPCFPTKD